MGAVHWILDHSTGPSHVMSTIPWVLILFEYYTKSTMLSNNRGVYGSYVTLLCPYLLKFVNVDLVVYVDVSLRCDQNGIHYGS